MKVFFACIAICIVLLSIAGAKPAVGATAPQPLATAEGLGQATSLAVESVAMAEPVDRVEVFKPDGSLQCGGGDIVSLADARDDLEDAGVRVYSAQKRHDGRKRIAKCGAPTGQILVFEIAGKDLDKARGQGFSKAA